MTGFVNGDTQVSATTGASSLTTTATASGVNTYTITAAAGTLASANYTFTFVNGTLSVTAATLTVTAQNASRPYGSANPTFTAAITGFVNGDTVATATTGSPSLTTTATASSPATNYTITAAAGTLAAANYTFTFVSATFTVTKVALTVTAQNASRPYGSVNPAFTAAITGFVNGDTQGSATTGSPSLTTTAIASSPATTYTITAAVGTLAATNYTFTFVNGTLTVTKVTLTVTAQDATRAFGAANPAFTAAFTGFVNGDTQTSTTTGSASLTTTASAVGPYTITAAIGTLASSDYSFTFVDGTLTITKATPAFTWNPTAITYGVALGSGQLDASSPVAGSFVYTPGAGVILTAGSQSLSAAFTPMDTTDYNNATATATLTVNKATPTIAWITPAAIPSGTALSATQLDATANPSTGTLVYTPALGAMPADGLDTLSVTFALTDATDYNTATATVVLTVGSVFDVVLRGSATDVINSGAADAYHFEITPEAALGTLPAAVTFSVTGLPPGATVTFRPAMIPAGRGPTGVEMIVHTEKVSSNPLASRTSRAGSMSVALGMLLLPMAGLTVFGVKPRRIPQRLTMLLLVLMTLGAITGLASCSGLTHATANAVDYPLVLTATSGQLQHSANLTLTVNQ
jgi:hypothetical protein